jgi:hypothetical protein
MVDMSNKRQTNIHMAPSFQMDSQRLERFRHSYDKRRDVLFIHKEPNKPAVSWDADGLAWVRFDPETGEILGFEIEDFETVFLKKFPEAAAGWREIKPRIMKKQGEDKLETDYVQTIWRLVKSLVNSKPSQLATRPSL